MESIHTLGVPKLYRSEIIEKGGRKRLQNCVRFTYRKCTGEPVRYRKAIGTPFLKVVLDGIPPTSLNFELLNYADGDGRRHQAVRTSLLYLKSSDSQSARGTEKILYMQDFQEMQSRGLWISTSRKGLDMTIHYLSDYTLTQEVGMGGGQPAYVTLVLVRREDEAARGVAFIVTRDEDTETDVYIEKIKRYTKLGINAVFGDALNAAAASNELAPNFRATLNPPTVGLNRTVPPNTAPVTAAMLRAAMFDDLPVANVTGRRPLPQAAAVQPVLPSPRRVSLPPRSRRASPPPEGSDAAVEQMTGDTEPPVSVRGRMASIPPEVHKLVDQGFVEYTSQTAEVDQDAKTGRYEPIRDTAGEIVELRALDDDGNRQASVQDPVRAQHASSRPPPASGSGTKPLPGTTVIRTTKRSS